MILFIAVWIF